MAESKSAALEALYAGIVKTAGELDGYDPSTKGRVLRDLGLAYRYASGGPQPGSTVVEQ